MAWGCLRFVRPETWGSGFRVEGLGFRVYGLGFNVEPWAYIEVI